MRLAVMGGTGRIGGHLLTVLAGAGHEMTVLARDPGPGLAGPGSRAVTAVRGDATDPAAVQAAVDGADAVLSALGPRGARTPALLGTAARNITAAMEQTSARRLICVSAAGAFITGDPDMGALIKLILPRLLAKQFADTREMEQVTPLAGWTGRSCGRPGW